MLGYNYDIYLSYFFILNYPDLEVVGQGLGQLLCVLVDLRVQVDVGCVP